MEDTWVTHLKKCQFNLGTYIHNPLLVWLQAMQKEEYPTVTIDSNKVTVDWGQAQSFRCDKRFEIKTMKIEMKHDETVKEDQATENKFGQTVFESVQKGNYIDLRCLPWKIKIKLTMEMLKFKGKNQLRYKRI